MKLKTIRSGYLALSFMAEIITAPIFAARILDEYDNAAAKGIMSPIQAYDSASEFQWWAHSAACVFTDEGDWRYPVCYIGSINSFSFTVLWSTSAGVYKLNRAGLYFVPNP